VFFVLFLFLANYMYRTYIIIVIKRESFYT